MDNRTNEIREGKTLVMNPPKTTRPAATLGIQSDTAFNETAKNLVGRDLCSIADLSVSEMAAIMELSHAVKAQPVRPQRVDAPVTEGETTESDSDTTTN